jgi:hypothetical protein
MLSVVGWQTQSIRHAHASRVQYTIYRERQSCHDLRNANKEYLRSHGSCSPMYFGLKCLYLGFTLRKADNVGIEHDGFHVEFYADSGRLHFRV